MLQEPRLPALAGCYPGNESGGVDDQGLEAVGLVDDGQVVRGDGKALGAWGVEEDALNQAIGR